MKLETIRPDVHRLQLGIVNLYLIRLGDQVVLVDSGVPSSPPAVLGVLGQLGLRPEQLVAILLTHRHLDHVGGAAALAEHCGAEVLIHEEDAAAIEGRERLTPVRPGPGRALLEGLVAFSDRRVFRFRPVTVRAVVDGFCYRDELRLVHAPGHTPGHSAWHLERSGVVFAGDAAMNHLGRLRQPSRLFTLDPGEARRSQQRLAELRGELYAFGHGPPLDDARALVRLADRY